MNKFKDAFSNIRPEEGLQQKTIGFVLSKQKKAKRPNRWALAVAVSCVFVFLLFGGTSYMATTASISMDLNPSIELSLNRYDRVLRAIAHNEEGQALLSSLALRNKPYKSAAEELMQKSKELGYLKDDSFVVFAVQCENETQQQTLLMQSETLADKQAGSGHSCCYAVDSDTWNEAQQCGMSAGKYCSIEELRQYDKNATTEIYSSHSTHEIHRQIHSYQTEENGTKAHHKDKSSSDHNNPPYGQSTQEQPQNGQESAPAANQGHHGRFGGGHHNKLSA